MRIPSGVRSYDVHIGPVQEAIDHCSSKNAVWYVSDANVWQHYADGLLRDIPPDDVILLPAVEELKTLDSVDSLYERLISCGARRNMTLVSIGGGIVQDITGFVASTLYRGVDWVFVPTTLLAQADSSIGSKTSLNFRKYKNVLGSFYPPMSVWTDVRFVLTQDDDSYFSGLGEVIKLHLIGGRDVAARLLPLLPRLQARDVGALDDAVRQCLKIKGHYIAEDEFDTGVRNLLNFGHCFGHALESVTRFAVPHGQAVVAGMIFANLVSRSRQMMSPACCYALEETLLRPCLKAQADWSVITEQAIFDAMRMDKKWSGGDLALILLRDDYTLVKVNDFSKAELARTVGEFLERIEIRQGAIA